MFSQNSSQFLAYAGYGVGPQQNVQRIYYKWVYYCKQPKLQDAQIITIDKQLLTSLLFMVVADVDDLTHSPP